MMTISGARKILGKLAEDISDETLREEVESASLLKDIFFKMYKRGLNESKKRKVIAKVTNHVE